MGWTNCYQIISRRIVNALQCNRENREYSKKMRPSSKYIFHCYFSFTFFLTVCRLYRCRSAFIVASDWFVLPI